MHRNENLIRDACEAYRRNDVPGLTANWTTDAVWHVRGTTPLAGDYRGAEKILAFMAESNRLSDAMFELEVEKVFADDEIGVAVCRTKVTIAGKKIDTLTTHVHRLVDGKVAESWFLFDDAIELNAAQEKALRLVPAPV